MTMRLHANSFFIRLFFSTLLLAVAMVIAVDVIIYNQLNDNYQARSKKDQEQYTSLLLKYFSHTIVENPDDIERECNNLSVESRYRITVIAADGRVLGDSEVSSDDMENHKTKDRPEVWAAFNKKAHTDIRHSSTLEVDFRYYAMPVIVGDKVIGVVRTAMPVITIAQGEGVIKRILLWASVATLIMSAGLGLLISWLWNRPLKEITSAAKRLADGELNEKLHITAGTKELSQLAGSLNEMREKLAEKIGQITSQRENLHTVMENLTEGVMALDYDGRIILLNTAAGRLIGLPAGQCRDKMLQNVVRIPDLLDVVSRARTSHENIKSQLRLENGEILEVQAYSVRDGGDNDIATLMVLRDLTDTEKMTAIKTQFVANASHELRTPLATIRAAVDSLKLEGISDTVMFERLLDILDRHTRRLEDMTNDLLDLHMVESSGSLSRRDSATLGRLRDWILNNFSAKADEKKVSLSVECSKPEFVFTTELTLVHLILQNLLTNSIKFTPDGGNVTCSFIPGEHSLCMRVSDTGCGIPAEFHDRVFERFFQVSTSRSRESGGHKNGGTGLGLSIVKHAAMKLGAGINLESEAGKGTSITIELPLP